MNNMYTKSELCKNAGITPETLRHYVDIGLIKPKEITEKGYRKYDRDNILDLWFYRLGASLGNPLKEVKKWNTAMSMENFVFRLQEREQELENAMARLEQQLAMIREIRHYTEQELNSDQTVTREPGLAGYRAFCDGGEAAQRQIARMAELFPMVSIAIDYCLPENWREVRESYDRESPLKSRLGICLLKERAGLMDLSEKEGLEEMPAMDSLCVSLVTDRPFALGWRDFYPLLEEADRGGYELKSDIIGSLFCREVAKDQIRYLLKCRILVDSLKKK
ncbi:MAG: MerR family transcriptional regulator [Hungatella sp.]|nr:MerR family transcriptional regulator [Hungatella sp.]